MNRREVWTFEAGLIRICRRVMMNQCVELGLGDWLDWLGTDGMILMGRVRQCLEVLSEYSVMSGGKMKEDGDYECDEELLVSVCPC